MRKSYEKPNLAIEEFVTEAVMNRENALHSLTYNLNGTTWDFLEVGETGSKNNVLNSVTYSDFIAD